MTEVRIFEHAEILEDLIELYKIVFGRTMTRELWEWMYIKNPLNPPEAKIVAAVDNGQVIGARPLMFFELWIKGRKVKAAQPSSTMVHPEYRRQGIFTRMNQLAIEYLKENGYASVIYNFPGPMSKPGYLKQGWKLVAQIGSLIKILNAAPLFSYKLHNKLIGFPLGLVYTIFSRIKMKDSIENEYIKSRLYNSYNEEFNFVDSWADKTKICLVRSPEFLKWRFAEHPIYKYKYLFLYKNDEAIGFMVLNTKPRPYGLIGEIIDYAVRNDEYFGHLVSEGLKELFKLGCVYVSIWETGLTNYDDLLKNKLRFKSSRNFPLNRHFKDTSFVVRVIEDKLLEGIDLFDPQNWIITSAFHDSM
jgi:GNAT superfamily N-acetyltransferase